MTSLFVNVSRAVFTLAVAFAATPVFAGHVLDFQVLGRGSVVSDCVLASPVDCTIQLNGQASGTHIGHDDFQLNLRVTPAGSRLFNGDALGTPPLQTLFGLCVVVHGTMTIIPPSVDTTIEFKVAGLVCEENTLGTPAGFNLHYRILDEASTGRFAGRTGGGSLTGSYTRNLGGVPGGGAVRLHLHGTIDR